MSGTRLDANGIAVAIVPTKGEIRLRAAAAADEPFLRDLFKANRTGDFAAAGLPPPALDALLEQQFRAQRAGHAAQFPDVASLIVLRHGEPVGRVLLATGGERWRIIDIVLGLAARGRGYGSDIIGAVARAAREQGARELLLAVLATNAAARRLYLRLGFVETGDGVHVEMMMLLADQRPEPSRNAE